MSRVSVCLAAALFLACNADRSSPPPLADAEFDAQIFDAAGPDFGPSPAPAPGPRVTRRVEERVNDPLRLGLYARNPADGAHFAVSGEARFFSAELSRLLPVLVYARRVSTGSIDPTASLVVEPVHLRGRGLRSADIGAQLRMDELVRRTLLDNDRTAEAMLVEQLGGVPAVEAVIREWAIDGIDGYLEPCERDRAFAEGLDPRFQQVDCGALGAYLHAEDPRGLSPLPFPTPPEFDPATRLSAMKALDDMPRGSSTPRGWGQLLTRLAHRTLQGGVPDAWLLDLLDDCLGAAGGGDGVPPSAWVGAIGSTGYGGTHWLGHVRRGDEAFVGVVHLVHSEGNQGQTVSDLVGAAWTDLMDTRDAWPPIPLAPRHGFHSAWVLAGEDADGCEQAPARFEDQLRCRRDAATGVFASHARTAVSVILQASPAVEIAWFWSGPDGRRRRFQRRLESGPWWVWTRGHRPLASGEWHAVIYVNGDAQSVTPFTVR